MSCEGAEGTRRRDEAEGADGVKQSIRRSFMLLCQTANGCPPLPSVGGGKEEV